MVMQKMNKFLAISTCILISMVVKCDFQTFEVLKLWLTCVLVRILCNHKTLYGSLLWHYNGVHLLQEDK